MQNSLNQPVDSCDRVLLSQLTQLLSGYLQLQLEERQSSQFDVSEGASVCSYGTCNSKSSYPSEGPSRTISLTSMKSSATEFRARAQSFAPASKPVSVNCNCHTVSSEEILLIDRGFHSLYSQLEGTSAVRLIDNEPLIYDVEVEALFLDAYVSSDLTLRVLLEPIRRSKWVSIDAYRKAVMRIYRSDLMTHSLSSKASTTWKLNYSTLKLLCKSYAVFFKLLSYNDCLHKAELPKVVGLAFKGSSEAVQFVVMERLLSKVTAKRGFDSDVLTLKELYQVLKL